MNHVAHTAPSNIEHDGKSIEDHDLQQTAHVFSLIFIGVSLVLILFFFLAGILSSRNDFIYLAFAILMSFIPILIGFSRKDGYDLFEPINVAAGAIFLGTTLRAFYLVFMPGQFQARFLMLHQSFQDVNRNIIWVLVGVAFFCLGYLVSFKRVPVERIAFLRSYRINLQRFNGVLIASVLLSLVGLYLYVSIYNISLGGNILAQSVKRSAEYVSDSGEVVYGSGWQGQVSKAAIYGSVALATAIFAQLVRITPYSMGLMAALVLSSVFVPFLGQTRSPIILLMFNITVAAAYYGRIRTRSAVSAFLGVALLVSAMGAIRASNSFYTGASTGFIENTVGSGNGFDSVRTTAIISLIPKEADFQYGMSYLAIPFFWVPRAIWPDKPQADLGAWVKSEIFGQRVQLSGWPPGLVGDAYINFGYIGIIIIPFIYGLFLRMFYESFKPYLGVSFPMTTIYVSLLYTIAWHGLDLNVSFVFALALAIAFPMLVILFLSQCGNSRFSGRQGLATRPPHMSREARCQTGPS